MGVRDDLRQWAKGEVDPLSETQTNRSFTFRDPNDAPRRPNVAKWGTAPSKEDLAQFEYARGYAQRPSAYYAYETKNGELQLAVIQTMRVIYRQYPRTFDGFQTPWEHSRSILTVNVGGSPGGAPVAAVGKLFTPVVQDTGDGDALVVGHVGKVNGGDLITTHDQAIRGGEPVHIVRRGGTVFVAEEENPLQSRLPVGWEPVGFTSHSYTVYCLPDGQVHRILSVDDNDGLKDANWVIDYFIAPALASVTLRLMYAGARVCTSLVGSIRGRLTRSVLAGPTRELAEAEAAAVASRIGAGASKAAALQQTNLRAMEAYAKTLLEAGGTLDTTAAGARMALDRYGIAGDARTRGYLQDLLREADAYAKTMGTRLPDGGWGLSTEQWKVVEQRVEAKWGSIWDLPVD